MSVVGTQQNTHIYGIDSIDSQYFQLLIVSFIADEIRPINIHKTIYCIILTMYIIQSVYGSLGFEVLYGFIPKVKAYYSQNIIIFNIYDL